MGCHRATPTGAAGERASGTGRIRVEALADDRSLSHTLLRCCQLSLLEWRILQSGGGGGGYGGREVEGGRTFGMGLGWRLSGRWGGWRSERD